MSDVSTNGDGPPPDPGDPAATSDSAKPGGPWLSRRRLLTGVGGLGAVGLFGAAVSVRGQAVAGQVADAHVPPATGTLPIPPLLNPVQERGRKVFRLRMQTGQTMLKEGYTTASRGFNGSYLGPTMKVNNGDRVRMEVTNNIGVETTVHWHGLHVPPSADGGPQNLIAPNAGWAPEFTIKQDSATCWYHPHPMGETTAQVVSGLAGMLLVTDAGPASSALPHTYGVDQFPLILQSVPMTAEGVLPMNMSDLGRLDLSDTRIIVNGKGVETVPTLRVNTGRIRLHLLNASNGDVLVVSRSDGRPLTQIATDAALLPQPATVPEIRLTSGARAEILLDLTDDVTLQTRTFDATNAPDDHPTPVLTVSTTAPGRPRPLPRELNRIRPLPREGAVERTFTLTGLRTGPGAAGTVWMINGTAVTDMKTMMDHAIMTTLDATEVWTIVNDSPALHSFHLHDVPFQVLDRDGTPPTGTERGSWRDTLEIPMHSAVRIIMKFTDYADDRYGYMFHCHHLLHEDQGMMAMIMVMNH